MGHERLAATTSRLGKRGLAGCEITARCARVATGSKATTACVAKTRLAAIPFTVTAWGKTTITAAIVAAHQARFPAIIGPRKEDICYATTNRQAAVKAMATKEPIASR